VEVSFMGSESMSALKIDTPVKEIPLAVENYSNSFMKAIETTELSDLYSYMTGVNRTGDTAYDFSIRGFTAGEPGNVFFNGLPGPVARFGSASTTNIERIEVLKGPASVLYGQAKPGGVINIITKKPQATRELTVDLRGGTFAGGPVAFGDSYSGHAGIDLTGPVSGNDVLYRVSASYDSNGSYRDNVRNKLFYVDPQITWNLSGSLSTTLELEYRQDRTSYDTYAVAPKNNIALAARINKRYEDPNDFLNEDGFTANLFVNKTFGKVVWNTSLRSVFHNDERNAFEVVAVTADSLSLTRRDRIQKNRRSYQFLDSNVKIPFNTGSVSHNFLVGVGGGYELRDFDRLQFATNASLTISIYDPTSGYGKPRLATTPGTHLDTQFYNYGAYAQDQISFSDQWKGLLGVRYDGQDSDQVDLRVLTTPERKNYVGALLPLVGLVFQPTKQFSAYASYATSFTPVDPTLLDVNGQNTFVPEKGSQMEAGIKADLPGQAGDATVAVFQITKKNVINSVGNGPFGTISAASGEERSRGFEVEIHLQPMPNFQTIVGYAYTDATVTEDLIAAKVGARILNAPKHGANLWSRYDFRSGGLNGFGLGLGVVYASDRAGSLPPFTTAGPVILVLPAYARIDGGIYYTLGQLEFTLKGFNLGNHTYFESAFTTLNIRPGATRSVTLSMRARI
jgi:iron complex outermembrane receptor protein